MRGEPRSRVLVTGGAGFIGRRLVRALVAAGHEVTVVDLRPYPGDGIGIVTGDIRDDSVLARAVRPGTDTIIHLAAITSVVDSIADPVGTYQTNVAATASLLELARTTGVTTFLFASTNAVVGNVGAETITERSPLRPLSPYGATKAAAEMLLSCYAGVYGMTTCAMRFSNVYGPGMQQKDSFIPRLMRAARDGKGVQVRGDGSMTRDVIHVDDVVAGHPRRLAGGAHRAGHPRVWPVGFGDGHGGSGQERHRRAAARRARARRARRNARGPAGQLGGARARLRARVRPEIGPGHGLARVRRHRVCQHRGG